MTREEIAQMVRDVRDHAEQAAQAYGLLMDDDEVYRSYLDWAAGRPVFKAAYISACNDILERLAAAPPEKE